MKIRIFPSIFFIFILSSQFHCQNKNQIYKCIHSNEEEKSHLPNTIIKRNEIRKRRIQNDSPSSEFKDFNIFLDLENIKKDITKNNLQSKMNVFITSMQKAVNTLQTLLKVKPLDTTDGEYYIRDSDFETLNISYWDKEKFGDGAIEKQNSFQKLNIDLAIFGSLEDLPESTLATASANAFQPSNGQPYIGTVRINKKINLSKPNSQVYFEAILVHEFTHILGFSIHFFKNYYHNIEYKTDKYGIERIYLNSPILLQVAKKYFNCDSLTGVELENQGGEGTAGSHWEARILLGEYMNGYSYTEEQVISEFTLAVLEDSGYYKPNYYTGGLMRYGKNKGCDFLENKCVDTTTHKIDENNENEFYDTIIGANSIESSCSSGRQSRTYKIWYTSNSIPSEFQYFENNEITGFEPADFCPVFQKYYDEEARMYYVGHCSSIGGTGYGTKLSFGGLYAYSSKDTIKFTGETFSDHSFCYLSSLTKNELISKVIKANCYESFCSDKSLTIKIFDDYIVCPRAGGKIKAEGYLGYLLCPDYNLICTGTKICNNIFDCVDKKSEIKEESYNYDYTIKTSQNLEKANLAEVEITENYELSETGGQCPQYCKHCKANKKCIKCKENFGLKLEDNNSIKCYDLDELSIGYFINEENVHIKCIENCDECDNAKTCNKCHENYIYINNACIEIPESKRDNIIENCLEYNTNFVCLQCISGYAFKANDRKQCYNIETDFAEFYSRDNGISYFPCSTIDSNCNKCYYKSDEFRVKCTHCINGLILLDIGRGVCKEKEEITNDIKYYLINNTHAGACSKDIENCYACDNQYSCSQCLNNYEFDYNERKCVSIYKKNKIDDSEPNIEGSQNKKKNRTSRISSCNYFYVWNILIVQMIYFIFLVIL